MKPAAVSRYSIRALNQRACCPVTEPSCAVSMTVVTVIAGYYVFRAKDSQKTCANSYTCMISMYLHMHIYLCIHTHSRHKVQPLACQLQRDCGGILSSAVFVFVLLVSQSCENKIDTLYVLFLQHKITFFKFQRVSGETLSHHVWCGYK